MTTGTEPEERLSGDAEARPDDEQPFADRIAAFVRANSRLLAIAAGILALVVLVLAAIPDGETTPTTAGPNTEVPNTEVQTTTGPSTTIGQPTVPQLEILDTAAVVSTSGLAVSVDGDLSEWQTLATAYTLRHPVDDDLVDNRFGQDSVGTLWVTHDDEALFLAVEVDDDVYSQPNEGNQIWRGDAVDLNLFADPGAGVPARPDSRTFQLTMTPRSDITGDPAAVLFSGNGERFDDNTTALPVAIAGVIDADGDWRMEARIPWSVFGRDARPGNLDAALFAVFDNDGETAGGRSLQAEIVTNLDGVFFQQPRTWGSLSFE